MYKRQGCVWGVVTWDDRFPFYTISFGSPYTPHGWANFNSFKVPTAAILAKASAAVGTAYTDDNSISVRSFTERGGFVRLEYAFGRTASNGILIAGGRTGDSANRGSFWAAPLQIRGSAS